MNIYQLKDHWTVDDVWEWLRQAALTDRVMPSAKIAGYRGFWPDIPKDPNEAYGYNEEEERPDPATNREATIWFEVCHWLVALEDDYERDIVWSKALPKPIPMKILERRHKCSLAKLKRDRANSILYLTQLLNAKTDFHDLCKRKAKKMAQPSCEPFLYEPNMQI